MKREWNIFWKHIQGKGVGIKTSWFLKGQASCIWTDDLWEPSRRKMWKRRLLRIYVLCRGFFSLYVGVRHREATSFPEWPKKDTLPCWVGVSSVSKCVQGDGTESSPLPLSLALALNFIVVFFFLVLPSVLLFLRALPVVGRRALFTVHCLKEERGHCSPQTCGTWSWPELVHVTWSWSH